MRAGRASRTRERGARAWRSALAAALRTGPATARTWRLLGPEQRAAGIGAVLLAVSTLGPFSWLEAATLLVSGGVLLLLKKRADRAQFHLPFGDGTTIAAAGAWAALLVALRFLDRSLGQGLLALACAGLLIAAGLRERAKRPADDLPTVPLEERP
jgi:hypothetical protein